VVLRNDHNFRRDGDQDARRRPGLSQRLQGQGWRLARRCEDLSAARTPNAPVQQFWSLTVYDVATRGLINNKEEIADRSSRQPDVVKNPDGSVDLYVGPKAPAGFEKNWIPTVPSKAWFPYFRLYAPTEAHFNRTWVLPDFERVK